MKNAFRPVFLISFFLFFLFITNYVESQTKVNIFANNIFDGISSSPEFYGGKDFSIQESIPEEGDYADRLGANMVAKVKNSKIEITYWKVEGEYRIQLVIIKDKTDLSAWGKYIGESMDIILKQFEKPSRANENEITYVSGKAQYFMRFELVNRRVSEIVFGLNF